MTKKALWIKELTKLRPCSDALKWAEQFPTAQEAWEACERGDWMLWYVARVGLNPERHKTLVKATCIIVERHLHLIPLGEDRPRKAITITLAWTEDRATLEDVITAARAAAEAAEAARAAARAARAAAEAAEAARAAWAAAEAAWAVADVAEAARAAAEAAWAAWVAGAAGAAWAAWAARAAWAVAEAAGAAWAAEYKAQAIIIRQYLTCPEASHD